MALKQTVEFATAGNTRAPLPHLSEAQIVSLEKEYMGEAQKRYFRQLLLASENFLAIRGMVSAAEIAIASAGADPIDRASAEEEHQHAIAARARDAAQLIEVRAALRRIDADEFGWCIETGEMIGIGRLLVCPTATLSVEAQRRHEIKTTRYRN